MMGLGVLESKAGSVMRTFLNWAKSNLAFHYPVYWRPWVGGYRLDELSMDQGILYIL